MRGMVSPQVPKKFNAFETPGPGRYDGTLNRTGDASFTKNTSSPSFGFGSGTYADGPKRYGLSVPTQNKIVWPTSAWFMRRSPAPALTTT